MYRVLTAPPLLITILVALTGLILQSVQLNYIHAKTSPSHSLLVNTSSSTTYPIPTDHLTLGPLSFALTSSALLILLSALSLIIQSPSRTLTSHLHAALGPWPLRPPFTTADADIQRLYLAAVLQALAAFITTAALIATATTLHDTGAFELRAGADGVPIWRWTRDWDGKTSGRVPENWLRRVVEGVRDQGWRLGGDGLGEVERMYVVARAGRWIGVVQVVLVWATVLGLWAWARVVQGRRRWEREVGGRELVQEGVREDGTREE